MSIEVGSKLQGKVTGITNLELLLSYQEVQQAWFISVK